MSEFPPLAPDEMQRLGLVPPAEGQAPQLPLTQDGMNRLGLLGAPPITVHPDQQQPAHNLDQKPDWMNRFITAKGRAVNPVTKQPYPEIRDFLENIIEGAPSSHFGLGKGRALQSAFLLEPDEMKRAQLLAKEFPGAKVVQDGHEIIVDFPQVNPKTGKPYGPHTMNRVGVSWQDADEVVQETALGAPIMRLAGLGKTLGQRAGLMGAGSAAMEAGRQAGSVVTGARENVSGGDVATSAVMGVVLGAGGETAFNLLKRAFATKALTTASGTLTPQGALILNRLGLDADKITLEALREIEPLIARAGSPAEALRLWQFRDLGVKPTQGQITRDPKTQGFEQKIARGGTQGTRISGPEEELWRHLSPDELMGAQKSQLRGAMEKTSERVSGQRTSFSPETGHVATGQGSTFSIAHERLLDAAKQMRNQFKAAYQEAFDRGASLMPDKLSSLSHALQDIKKGYAAHPQVGAVAADLATIIKEAAAGGAVPVKLQQLEERVRKSISTLGQDNNSALKSAAGEMRSAYSKWETALRDPDFVKGGPEAVAAFRRGRDIRADYASRFEDDTAIETMLKAKRMPPDKPGGKPTWEIETPSSEAIRGILAKPGDRSAKTFERLRRVLALAEGPNGPAWQGVKREVFADIAEKGAMTFQQRWEDFLRSRPETAKIVFGSGDDSAHMTTMAGVSRSVQPVEGAVNRSNTFYAAAREAPALRLALKPAQLMADQLRAGASMRQPMPSGATPFPLRAPGAMATQQPEAGFNTAQWMVNQIYGPPDDPEAVARTLRNAPQPRQQR